MSKRALGRGLGALIPGADDDNPTSEIPVERITANPYQPRRTFTKEALEELAQSIAQHGLLQPVVVRSHLGRYQLAVGERRWRAAKLAGKETIPAIITDLTDRQLAEIALVENLQREDLNPIEEATAFSQLIRDFNLTQEVLATRVGRSRPAIANTMRLLNLAPPVQRMVAEGRLSPGHARTLLSMDTSQQLAAAEKILSEGLTVRDAEKKKKVHKPTPPKANDPNIVHLQNQLMEHLGTKVSLEEKDGKGRIIIDFYSVQDASRIVKSILN